VADSKDTDPDAGRALDATDPDTSRVVAPELVDPERQAQHRRWVHERDVFSPEQVERYWMHGSPTIRVNGDDPFAGPDPRPSLSCRLYGSDQGASGAPTVAELAAAVAW
jgi:hypothetical protein